jgi:hypothetical protein
VNYIEGRHRCVHQLAGHGSGWQVEPARILEHYHIGVTKHGHSNHREIGQSEGPRDLVAVGRADIEALDASYRDSLGCEESENFRRPGPDSVDD